MFDCSGTAAVRGEDRENEASKRRKTAENEKGGRFLKKEFRKRKKERRLCKNLLQRVAE